MSNLSAKILIEIDYNITVAIEVVESARPRPWGGGLKINRNPSVTRAPTIKRISP